jgi:hypothetical protein
MHITQTNRLASWKKRNSETVLFLFKFVSFPHKDKSQVRHGLRGSEVCSFFSSLSCMNCESTVSRGKAILFKRRMTNAKNWLAERSHTQAEKVEAAVSLEILRLMVTDTKARPTKSVTNSPIIKVTSAREIDSVVRKGKYPLSKGNQVASNQFGWTDGQHAGWKLQMIQPSLRSERRWPGT